MKQLLLPFALVFLFAGFSCQLNAQKKDKKEKTVTIKIEKEVDGQKTMVDTTFTLKEGEDMHEILEKYGMKADIHHIHGNEFKFDIETDDSLHKESHAMVWVSVDDDGGKEVHKHIVKSSGKDNVIFISDNDEDVDVQVIKLKKGNKTEWVDEDENIFIEKLDGDSIKIKKKIIIKTDKDGKHKIKSKHGVFIVSDDEDIDSDDVIINELKHGDDSVEVIVKKLKKGKKGKLKKIIITEDGDYTWTVNEDDVIENKDLTKVKIEILDVDEQGLKVLKQKKGYQEFNEKDLDVFVNKNEDKINFEFSTTQKGALSVKIVDEKGNVVLEDVNKNFDGKYKNEIKAQSGTFYLQISVGKKYYIRKMIFEWDK